MITITQDLTALYPVFNDSFIKFTSDIDPSHAEVILNDTDTFPEPFLIFPSPDGEFLFNFSEIAKASFSELGFNQGDGTITNWGESFTDNKSSVQLTIKTYNGATNDSLAKTYTFYKSVVQPDEPLLDNYILSKSKNGIDFDLRYWEGFPFDFQIKDLETNDEISVKNAGSGMTPIAPIVASANGSLKVHIDTVSQNWTSANYLPLGSFTNKLEVYENDVFKANINIDRVEPCGGIYIRWTNGEGGFNYWLFDKFYRSNLNSRSMGDIALNNFLNAGSVSGKSVEFGKDATRSLRVKTLVNKKFKSMFESLYLSPNIEMYSETTPFTLGTWSPVKIEGTFNDNVKRDSEEYTLTIDLPKPVTITR